MSRKRPPRRGEDEKASGGRQPPDVVRIRGLTPPARRRCRGNRSMSIANIAAPPDAPAPLLRTLPPALRGLERSLRAWLDGPRRYPLSMMGRAALEGLASDL